MLCQNSKNSKNDVVLDCEKLSEIENIVNNSNLEHSYMEEDFAFLSGAELFGLDADVEVYSNNGTIETIKAYYMLFPSEENIKGDETEEEGEIELPETEPYLLLRPLSLRHWCWNAH